MYSIQLAKTLGSTVLVGATLGKTGHAALLKALRNVRDQLIVLDMSEIEVLSASYYREAIAPLGSWCHELGAALVLANVPVAVADDVTVALEAMGGVAVVAVFSGDRLSQPRVLGKLDEKLDLTLRLVCDAGTADASAVATASGESTVVTAWNNRLVALTKMGVLQEQRQGKTKFYSPIVKGLRHGR